MQLLLLPLMYTDMLPIKRSGTVLPEWSNLYAPSINKGKRKGKPHIWARSSFGISNFYTEKMCKNAQKIPVFQRNTGIFFWRRRRDLNPRYPFGVYTISNRARSASYATSPSSNINRLSILPYFEEFVNP